VLQVAAFPASPVSFGLICDFVSRFPPFDAFEFRQMAVTLRHQLEAQSHLVAGLDDDIVAYLGWIRTSRDIAEAWMSNQGPLTALAQDANAIVVTVLVASDRKHILPLLRKAKTENPGLPVYWKRQLPDEARTAKRSVRKKAD
jgi:hypothetical protein